MDERPYRETPIGKTYILENNLIIQKINKFLVMHPLPRNEEISTELDQDPRAVYMRQAQLGVYVRNGTFGLDIRRETLIF